MIYLINSSGIPIEQNQSFLLEKDTTYFSTKGRVKSGLWYFEASHYSGVGYPIFGFHTNEGRIGFYPQGKLKQPRILLQENMRTNQTTTDQQIIVLPFSVEFPYTVGVGIDTQQHKFIVFYNHYCYTIIYNKKAKITSFDSDIWGSVLSITNENVSINFGAFPFQYTVPAFHPWEENVKPFYCTKVIRSFDKFVFFTFVLIG